MRVRERLERRPRIRGNRSLRTISALRSRRFRSRIGVAALAVVLAACSAPAEGGQDTGEPALGAIPNLLAAADLRLPAQDYLATDAQNLQYLRAEVKLIQDCLRRFGVSYPVTPAADTNYGPRSMTDRRYGITDAALASTAGYGLGARDPALQTRPPTPDIGADGETALTGQGPTIVRGVPVPAGGCTGEARRTLDAQLPPGADLQLAQNLQMQSFEQAKRDSRVKTVNAAWSSCLAEHGYHYADPFAPLADPRFKGKLTPEQITVAATDIDCKGRTNLVGVWFSVESAYEARAIQQAKAAFDLLKQARAARQGAVDAVVPAG